MPSGTYLWSLRNQLLFVYGLFGGPRLIEAVLVRFRPSNYLPVFWVDSAFDSTRGTVRTERPTAIEQRTSESRSAPAEWNTGARSCRFSTCFGLLIVRNHQCSR